MVTCIELLWELQLKIKQNRTQSSHKLKILGKMVGFQGKRLKFFLLNLVDSTIHDILVIYSLFVRRWFDCY